MKKAYEYSCSDCKIIWEKDFEFFKPAKKSKCPECGRGCEQNWIGREAPAVHFKGGGWTTNSGHNVAGGSDEVNKKLQEQCKDRMEGGWKHYGRYSPSDKEIAGARKLTNREVTDRLDTSKKLSAHNYDKAKIDPTKKYKPQ
jgi:predicted nucleic acid-binding Zn ribbon protein